jgi:hypothetical protein
MPPACPPPASANHEANVCVTSEAARRRPVAWLLKERKLEGSGGRLVGIGAPLVAIANDSAVSELAALIGKGPC